VSAVEIVLFGVFAVAIVMWTRNRDRAFERALDQAQEARAEADKYRRRAAEQARKARRRGKTLRGLGDLLEVRRRDEYRVFKSHRDDVRRCLCWRCFAARRLERDLAVGGGHPAPVEAAIEKGDIL
jgi:hypothetical protein